MASATDTREKKYSYSLTEEEVTLFRYLRDQDIKASDIMAQCSDQ
jgi:hypothetical protein